MLLKTDNLLLTKKGLNFKLRPFFVFKLYELYDQNRTPKTQISSSCSIPPFHSFIVLSI
jgi:hypothetical protein